MATKHASSHRGGRGGAVQLDGFSTSETHQVNVRFADGTAWDPAALAQRADALPTLIVGTAADDYLSGWDRPDEFHGGQGNDTFTDYGGGDLYIYASGDGSDTIADYGSDSAADTLKLLDLNQGDIQLSRDANNLFVTDTSTNQIITVQDQFSGGTTGLESIVFGDGSTLSRDAFETIASTIQGTSGNDTFSIEWSKFLLDAGAGNDVATVLGSGGGTIVFGIGDGQDMLQSELGWGNVRNETLELRDLNAADVTLTQNGEALVVTANATGDTFTTAFQFNYYDEQAGLSRIVFADDTVWNRDDITANLSGGGFAPMMTSMIELPEPNFAMMCGRWMADAQYVHMV